MMSVSKFIEKKLKLVVNQEKSQVALSSKVTFLGMTIVAGTIAISRVSLNRARVKVKELTPRGTHETLEQTMARINLCYRGWSSYYNMTQYPAQLGKVEAPIRRRLRSRIVDQQKSRRNLYRKLMKRGVSRKQAANAVFTNNKRWPLSPSRALERACPNRWFIQEMGQFIRSTTQLTHWFDLRCWIR